MKITTNKKNNEPKKIFLKKHRDGSAELGVDFNGKESVMFTKHSDEDWGEFEDRTEDWLARVTYPGKPRSVITGQMY